MIALLANPDSGQGEAGDVAEAMRELGATVSVFGFDDIEGAVASRPERLVVAGGDGSLGSAAAPAARARIPLAVVPTGTANDFARVLGVPLETDEAVRVAVAGRETRRIDIAHMGERPFLNVASLGLSPAAAEHASGMKGALGSLAYTVGALRAGLTAHPVSCTVHCDGDLMFEGRAWQVSVASTGAFGGGSSVEADPADGRLDVVVIEAGSRARLVRHAYGLRAGELEGQPGIKKARCAAAEVAVEGTEQFNVDGELVESSGARFEVEPPAVDVVVG